LALNRTLTLVQHSGSSGHAGLVEVVHTLQAVGTTDVTFSSFEDVYETSLGHTSTAAAHGGGGGGGAPSLPPLSSSWVGKLPDVVWSQSIRRQPSDTVAHWNFKCPALVVQSDQALAALVVDLPPGSVTKDEILSHPTILDLRNPNNLSSPEPPTMAYGFAQASLSSHSIYGRTPDAGIVVAASNSAPATLRYILYIDNAAPDAKSGGDLQSVASLLWDRMGHAALSTSPQQQRNVNAPQNGGLFDAWRSHAWNEVAQSLLFEFACESGGAPLNVPCASIATGRTPFSNHIPNAGHDMWLNAWFQTLRQALAMHQYGNATNNATLQKQAVGNLVLALSSPQTSTGAFPTVFWTGDNGTVRVFRQNFTLEDAIGHMCARFKHSSRVFTPLTSWHCKLRPTPEGATSNWISDSGWAGLCNAEEGSPVANCSGFYHVFDMVWSAYWMLQWKQEPGLHAELHSRIDTFTKGVADFVVQHQEKAPTPVPSEYPNGMNGGGNLQGGIPAWYDPHTFEPRPEMRFNAETAAAALFLIEKHVAAADADADADADANANAEADVDAEVEIVYLQAAKAAMDFVEREIVPSLRWFDFETFVSCSGKPFDLFDNTTNQHPQNNLAMLHAALAELRLFEVTGNASRLEWGERILGRISLTQAVWSHPALTPVLSGGLTTQNTDAEWSDNRQQLAAVLYLKYYFGTPVRKPEYLERAVAALRSTFAIAPYENWAHTGGSQGDACGALSSAAHWGTCSAAASVEFTRSQLHDLFFYVGTDTVPPHGVCVNGCTLDGFVVSTVAGDRTVTLNVSSPFNFTEGNARFVVVVDGASQPLALQLNGHRTNSTYSVPELKRGVALPGSWL
jgi:hypothetical protein